MYLAAYKGTDRLANKVISWWLDGPYSHTEVVLGYSPAGEAVCASSSMLDGGVRVKHINLNPERWDLIPVNGDVQRAWKLLEQHAGASYDYLGLAGFIARVAGHSQGRFTCSEFCALLMGLEEPHRFDPCNLVAVARWR